MITRSPMNLFSITLFSFIIFCNYSSNKSIDFKFDVKNLNNTQRDRLFEYLDVNKDNSLSKTEFKTLLRQLFYSTKLKTTLVNDTNEEKIFNALNFTSIEKRVERDQFTELWNKWIKVILKPRSALIVIDVQNDFMNGSLTVRDGLQIIPFINDLIDKVEFDVVVYSKDWHPPNHCSFIDSAKKALIEHKIVNMSESTLKVGDTVYYKNHPDVPQKIWPSHCVQNTVGAQLYKGLNVTKNSFVVLKGRDPDIDSYSAFRDNNKKTKTDLDRKLQERGITDVYLSGVLYEFCVGETAKDALQFGYRTAFVENAIQSKFPALRDQMRQTLINRSANVIKSDDVEDMVNGRERTVEMGIVLAQKLFQTTK